MMIMSCYNLSKNTEFSQLLKGLKDKEESKEKESKEKEETPAPESRKKTKELKEQADILAPDIITNTPT